MSPRVGDSPSSAIHVSLCATFYLCQEKGLTPLNGKDLTTGSSSGSYWVGSVDLSKRRRDGESKSSGFGDE